MGVKAKYRKPNSLQFIETANDILLEVMTFVSYLTPMEHDEWGPSLCKLAAKVHNFVLEANEAYTGDKMRLKMRKKNFLKARGALSALSSMMSDLFDVIIEDPKETLLKKGGVFFSPGEALEKVDKTATKIGELIAAENAMIKALLKQTAEAFSKLKKEGKS